MALRPHEVYSFITPPILGGKRTIQNLQTMDFEVALTVSGQLHHQVRNLPPGTPISGFKIDPETNLV